MISSSNRILRQRHAKRQDWWDSHQRQLQRPPVPEQDCEWHRHWCGGDVAADVGDNDEDDEDEDDSNDDDSDDTSDDDDNDG